MRVSSSISLAASVFVVSLVASSSSPSLAKSVEKLVCPIDFGSSGSASVTFAGNMPISYSFNGQEQPDARMSRRAIALDGGRVTWSGKPKSGATLAFSFTAKPGTNFHDAAGSGSCTAA